MEAVLILAALAALAGCAGAALAGMCLVRLSRGGRDGAPQGGAAPAALPEGGEEERLLEGLRSLLAYSVPEGGEEEGK